MDFFTISTAMAVFIFFIFLSIIFYNIRNRDLHKRNNLLSISSFFMFLSFLFFHIEFRYSSVGSPYTFIFSFISFSCLMYSIIALAILIGNLYSERKIYLDYFPIFYAILSGIIYSLNTLKFTYLSGFILLGILIIVPGIFLGRGLLKAGKELFRTPFVYQIILLAFFYTAKMINLFNNPSISPSNPSSYDSVASMFILITLSMFYVTYLLEYNRILNIKLQQKAFSLNKTLLEVKLESEKDTLTRIPNRAKLNQMLEVCLSAYKEYDIDFSIAMIDVNNFKQINDLNGHIYGDKILIEISNTLQSCIRKDDIVGRWGGDEFLIIFPKTDAISTKNIRDKIINQFDQSEVTLSIGFATASECDDVGSILYLADIRMYDHKNIMRSRNTIK